MRHLPRLAGLVLDQHHAIMPSAAAAILLALEGRMGDVDLDDVRAETAGSILEAQSNAFVGRPALDREGRWRGYRVTDKGAAIVPIHGELVNRGSWLGTSSGLVSYEGLRQSLRNAADDPSVKSIVLDVNSPGGMVAGMFETAELVREIAARKPVVAVANHLMASAAYGIASGASEIVATDGAIVGSIGTVFTHTDRSAQLAKQGIKVTLIHSGAKKVAGTSTEPLPDGVRSEIQAQADKLRGTFVSLVHAGRPHLAPAAIRDTEAATYMGGEAVDAGLADRVATFDATVAHAESGAAQPRKAANDNPAAPRTGQTPPSPQKVAAKMTKPQGAPGADTDPGDWAAGLTMAQLEEISGRLQAMGSATEPPGPTADTVPAQPLATDTNAAYDNGRKAERERIKAILDSAEAKERAVAAQVLACSSDTDAAAVVALLAKMPKEGSGTAAALYGAMQAHGANPRVPLVTPAAPRPSSSLADGMKTLVAAKKGAR